ncbi:hypothetical protein PC118_g14454 [Phytophthora cactorum]|uniref:Uncharacterized protein n=1 Tax=Phytophthora cactorum TaxID=29920 RepID=A0A8T1FM79_9STRA|nr:hypothetical protein PC118_g14454 [Phytophthora cactorum]
MVCQDIAALPERTKEYPALYSGDYGPTEEFLAQLLEVTAADFLETFSPALSEQNSVAIPAEHELTEFPDWAHFLSTSEVVFDQATTLETACHATEYDALSAAERSAQERSARERVTMGLMGTVIAPETDKAI